MQTEANHDKIKDYFIYQALVRGIKFKYGMIPSGSTSLIKMKKKSILSFFVKNDMCSVKNNYVVYSLIENILT